MAMRQIDMKKIIAYSSIAHMNFALLGYFSYTFFGVMGGLFLMLSHGCVSSALFYLVGLLYDRYHTRLIIYYGGIVQTMPLFSLFFGIFLFSNFSFPGTSNFVGELLVIYGLSYLNSKFLLIISLFLTFYTLSYSLFLLTRILFLNIKSVQYVF
jgi:NADH:ubiquinone oxidoreductase subunit 4 (subunit M)